MAGSMWSTIALLPSPKISPILYAQRIVSSQVDGEILIHMGRKKVDFGSVLG